MPLKLKCRCGEKLSAPESAAGKKGKCPKCGMTFVIPGGPAVGAGASAKPPGAADPSRTASAAGAPSATAAADPFGLDLPKLGASGPLDDLFDESFDASMTAGTTLPDNNPFAAPQTISKPKKRGSTRVGMNRVANGIKLVFWGSVMMVGSILFALFAGTISAMLGPEFLPVVLAGVLFIQFAGGILSIIGRILCLAVPPQVGGKVLIVAAVALDGVGFVAGLLSGLSSEEEKVVFNLVGAAAGFATFILFVLFVRKVALSLKRKDLADDAKLVLVMIGVTFLSIAAVIIPCIGALFFLGMILYVMFKYLNLLQHTAEAARC